MKKLSVIKQNRGFTLVEALATIVITSIILALLTSILLNTAKESERQTAEAAYLNDARLILKSVTKDIRKSINLLVESDTKLILTSPDHSEVVYSFNGSKLSKWHPSEDVIAEELGCVNFIKKSDAGSSLKAVEVFISSNPEVTNCSSDSKYIKTTIIQLRNE